jgi:hypothetical protein
VVLAGCGPPEDENLNTPPVIVRIDVPSRLVGTDTVRVYVFDADGDPVSLNYTAVDQSGQTVTDPFLKIPADDGASGDAMAGDGIYTGYLDSPGLQGLPSNVFHFQFQLRDARNGQSMPVDVDIESCTPGAAPVISNLTAPDTINTSETNVFTISLSVQDTDGLFDVVSVTLTNQNGNVFLLVDNGSDGDVTADDGVFTRTFLVESSQPPGDYLFRFKARDCAGLESNELQKTIVIVN